MTLGLLVLALVTLQRAVELLLARRNTRRLKARGAVEVGADQYPAIVLLHLAWLLGLWGFGWNRPVQLPWLALFLVLQAGRAWVLMTLGERWTTRVLMLPNEPLVRRGPYRLIPHPNYLVVALEIPVLPLAFGLGRYALVFGLLNLALLALRIRVEGKALRGGLAPAAPAPTVQASEGDRA